MAVLMLTAPGAGARAAECLSGADASRVVGSGQVIPLGRIVADMRGRGMDITDARLCQRGGRFVYELMVVSRGGSVRKVTIDAHSGSGYGR